MPSRPGSKKIHLDIDPSQINKVVRADLGIVADAARAISEMVQVWKAKKKQADSQALKAWWAQIDSWRARKSLAYKSSDTLIKPQYAVDRLYELTRGRDTYITTEVGQHQMWAAQRFKFEEPNRWMILGRPGHHGLRPAGGGGSADSPIRTRW